MKEYCIVSRNVKFIKANSFDDLRIQFAKDHPDDEIESIQGKGLPNKKPEIHPLGKCENTGIAVFEHDKYQSDTEGIIWLTDENFYKEKYDKKIVSERENVIRECANYVASYNPKCADLILELIAK